MSLPILDREPVTFAVGSTVRWRKSLPDTPAPVWTLTYRFAPEGGGTVIEVVADADGSNFLVTLVASGFSEGRYVWKALVTDGTDTAVIAESVVTVTANFAASPVLDTRSEARQTLDLINQAIKGRLPSALDSYQIEGMQISKTPLPDLLTLRDRYAAIVRSEDNAARVAAGLPRNNIFLTRFR